MIQFPSNFLWGAATSGYQVEGNNTNCDWWDWEHKAGLKEPCGHACRHYELYREDFDLAKELNHNAHRLSIEWSRIEPAQGEFSEKEIAHYKDVIVSLGERNIEPVVTLHHFTNPLWFAKLGGWQNKKSSEYFLRYARCIVEALCDKVRYWITVNEPLVYIYHSYIAGFWPPQEKSFGCAKTVTENLALSHNKTFDLLHDIYRKRNLPSPMVSIAHNLQAFVACTPNLKNKIALYLKNKFYNFSFIERLIRKKTLDFIGVNYYNRSLVEVERWRFRNLMLDTCKKNHSTLKKNCLGWDIYPQGLYDLLLKLKKYNLPVLITENGICTDDDSARWDFIYQHLKNINRAMNEGVKVFGYIYWSLIDNFEWDKGFWPRFGLIGVDYDTYKRHVRESARKFAQVCRTGVLE